MVRVLIGALFVAVLSVLYNYFIFSVFDFYPDLPFDLGFLTRNIYILIFLKSFLAGLVLMYLFFVAYTNINKADHEMKGIIFMSLYAIFAFFIFSFGDILLMGSQEELFVLLTLDGLVETIIATVPIRMFVVEL